MAKIKTLNTVELYRLRAGIKQTFESRCPGAALKETSFRGSYDELRADILLVVPDSEPSVTTHRLRKLYYYTNPALCLNGQFESPSFGKDFLEAIDKYIIKPSQDGKKLNEDDGNHYPISAAIGGGMAGTLTAILTISFKNEIAYPTDAYLKFKESLALIFITQFFAGAVAGWLCGKAIKAFRHNSGTSPAFFKIGYLFGASMIPFSLIRQIGVTDAFYRNGGGLLGQPDFEMVGTALACAGGLVFLVKFVNKYGIPNIKKSVYFSLISSVFAGIISFGSIVILFTILSALEVLPYNDCNCLLSPSIFKFDFPHPERILFVVFFGFIYNMFILNFIRIMPGLMEKQERIT